MYAEENERTLESHGGRRGTAILGFSFLRSRHGDATTRLSGDGQDGKLVGRFDRSAWFCVVDFLWQLVGIVWWWYGTTHTLVETSTGFFLRSLLQHSTECEIVWRPKSNTER